MNANKASVTVRIAGEEHTIRATAEPSYTLRCATLVDDRIHQVRVQAGLTEVHKAAILAALSLADEFFQAEEELERLRNDLSQRATDLVERIDRSMPPPGESD